MPIALIRGMHGYATVLRSIIDGTNTARALATKHSATGAGIRKVLRGLEAIGLAHVRVESARTRPHVWTYGPGATPPIRKGRLRSEMLAFASVICALEQGFSLKGLVSETGVSRCALKSLLPHMKTLRLIYVGEWEPSRAGPPHRIFRFGVDQPDAPRPKPQTNTECCRRYMAGRRAREQTVQISMATAGLPFLGLPGTSVFNQRA